MNREAERKRLIETLSWIRYKAFPTDEKAWEFIADRLLDNGIIVPPCNVGDKVYLVGEITRQIVSAEVVAISTSANDLYLVLENGTWVSCNQQLGKTVFLTREQAEKALEGKGE